MKVLVIEDDRRAAQLLRTGLMQAGFVVDVCWNGLDGAELALTGNCPLAYAASGLTPEEATGAIVRGVTRHAGNEIDEFVTEALRNNLVGLPLDLAVLNLARGRDTGIPSFNAARADFYAKTGDGNLRPYTSWADFIQHMKHPESLINFIAAYGTHSSITSETTFLGKRAAATLIVRGGAGAPTDRFDFLNSTGDWASTSAAHPKDLDGVSTTGLGNIDFWIGGLAEEQTPFGGLLGSTFNFIFENQMEKLQDGDRFYYLERTAGLHFGAELEGNSFAKLIMANTDATHLPGLVFMTPAYTLEVDQSLQYTGLGIDGRADPTFESILLTPEVIRDNPDTLGPDENYLRYNGAQTVVLGGTAGDDIIIGGNADDDTLWGDAGNDFLDGGYGNDMIRGGAGDDIIIDIGGDDNIQGGDGNDVIQAGNGINLIIAGGGNDFIVTGEDAKESFGGEGNDFILGTKADEQNMGGEGDDWIEGGTSDGSPGDNFDPLGLDRIIGNDVYVGQGENDKFNAEGGDDIMVGSQGFGDRYIGGSGFDWATFKDDPFGITLDVLPGNRFFDQPVLPGSGASVLTRFDFVEGYAGSAHADVIKGDDFITLVGNGAQGSVLTNMDLIAGLQALLNNLDPGGPDVASFDGGNILLGGDEGDWLEGRGGNDLIDGDAWLNVRISVRANADGTGAEIDSFDSMRPLTPFMLNGTYNPGQLVIVREIKYAPGPDFDTAVFTGNLADYTITVDVNGTPGDASDDIVTVTDNVGLDGTDTLVHIERLQFADQAQVLAGANQSPVGSVTVIGVVAEDQLLRASVAGVSDGNNTLTAGAIAEPVAYFWQSETAPGVFTDIVNLAAGEVGRAGGPTFTPTDAEVGQRLRVRAVCKDQNGVLEEVYSAPTAVVANVNDAPTGAPTISDTTPTEDIAITALTGGISDPDGLTTAVFSFQWQSSPNGVTWTDIPLATGPTFTPLAAQVNLLLRVRVQFTDDHGTLETLFSAPTANVGDHITGNNNANTLNGGAFADWLEGLGGADNLNGNGGDDLLDGGNGNDTLNGGAGADTLLGGAGADTMNGGVGADTMSGGAANDTYIVEDAGDVVIEPLGEGTDTVQTSLLTYTLGGNVENLAILAGSTGNRVFTGNGLNNAITGNGGNDFLSGLAGDDTLNGGGANDTLDGGAGIDTLNGGAGNDTASYASETDAMFINLALGNTRRNSAAAAIEDTLLAIENALGGAGADTITGSNAANVMSGGGGGDTFLYTIGGGADTVDGGAGVDTLVLTGTGGANVLDVIYNGTSLTNFEGGSVVNVESVTADMLGGTDTLTYAGTTAAVSVNLTTGAASGFTSIAGTENVTGGDGADTLTGVAGVTNTLTGGGGNDTFVVHDTADLVSEAAGGGIDTVNSLANTYTITDGDLENLTFIGVGNFTGTGNGSDNVITGGAGTDVLNGGGGADTLIGGLSVDSLNGGAGDDRMTGGAGNDIMNGKAGNDTFVMGAGFGADIVSGFDASPDALNLQDRIDLVGMGITSTNFGAHVTIVDLGNDTLVTIDGNTMTLLGVNGVGANVITIADFILAP